MLRYIYEYFGINHYIVSYAYKQIIRAYNILSQKVKCGVYFFVEYRSSDDYVLIFTITNSSVAVINHDCSLILSDSSPKQIKICMINKTTDNFIYI